MAEPTTQPTQLGFGPINGGRNAPVVPTAWSLSEQRLKREQASTAGDYIGSIWRQDGLVDGLMATIVGDQMVPDPKFNPFLDRGAKQAEEGIWDEFKPSLYQAHSPDHREYIRGRLLSKQEDLTRMGDMGLAGNVGRIALNVLMPDQILMGMAGGWVTRGALAVKAARATRGASTALGRAEAVAGITAEVATAGSKAPAVAGGIAAGAGQNVAYERMRQSVNFEDDNAALFEAGLLGAAFTAPFALAGARSSRRLADVARREHSVLRALKDADEGKALTPEQGKLIAETHRIHTAVHEFNTGKLDAEGLERAMDELHGPAEPVDRWLDRFQDRLRDDARLIIDTQYPGGDLKRRVVSPEERAKMDARVEREAARNSARLEVPPEEPSMAIPDATPAPGDGAMASAFKKALMGREAARKADDLAALAAATDAAKKAERDAAWKLAEADREADRKAAAQAGEERLINSREEQRMLLEEDPLADAARGADAEPTVQAVDPGPSHDQWVGQEVSWAGPDGETLEGAVVNWNPGLGKLIVKTIDGYRNVRPQDLDQHAPSFGPQSIGAAQLRGVQVESTASQRTAMAEVTLPGTNVKVPVRFDIYATLNGSPVKRVRELAYRLVKDAIQNDKFDAQSMTASEWKKQLQRTAAGQFHVASREAFLAAVKELGLLPWQRPGFSTEFYKMVSQVTRGDVDVLAANPAIAPMLQKAAAAQAKAYRTLLEAAQKAGVRGADGIAPNDFYVNRVWHHGQIREALLAHGEDSVVRLIADSIIDKPGVIDKMRKAPGNVNLSDTQLLELKGKRFLAAVRAVQFAPSLQDMHLRTRDMGTLRRELEAMNVDADQIDDLVDLMFQIHPGKEDAGRTTNLKFRFSLDEGAQVVTQSGTLKLSDLFENDARVLVDTYASSMAGHTGLAKVGIPDQAAWMAELKKVKDEAFENPGIDGVRVEKDLALLDDVYRNITGRPMSTADFSATNRLATAMRGYTRGVLLPQLGIASAFEMGKAVALMGFKSLQQLPAFRSLLIGIRQGYVPDSGLARDIMVISGFGQEKAASYVRAQEIESGFTGQAITRAEAGANRVSHAVDVLSGNSSFTSLTKQLSGMMAAQNMADFAHGRRTFTAKLRERWVGQGINDDDIDTVLEALRKHSTEKDGVLQEIRHEDWNAADPVSYETFQTFLSRQVRDAIQDHDLGESMPFMHSTLGKMFAELKTFFLVAHAKNFLKNGHYMDATAAQVWAISFLAESLAYMTQTAVNFPTELDERLTPERIARAATFRMAALGTMSMAVETGYNVLSGGDSLVQPGMTANTDNRSFLNTPSMIVAKRLFNAPSTLGGLVLQTDTTTKAEFRDLWGAIPGANLYGLKAFGGYLAESFPKSDPEKTRTGP